MSTDNQNALDLTKEQPWNHRYDFNGIITKEESASSGDNVLKWQRMLPILNKINIEDKTIVDIGCSDGYYAVESAKITKKEVLGIDCDQNRIDKANFAKNFFNIDNLSFIKEDIYNKSSYKGVYDVSYVLGVIHRIPDIYGLLKIVFDISNISIIEFKTYDDDKPICLWGGGIKKSNEYNKLYFLPTIEFMKGVLQDVGFSRVKIYKDEISSLIYKRTIILARKG
jgi:tRNA (mo5U34)-methyltransferase